MNEVGNVVRSLEFFMIGAEGDRDARSLLKRGYYT